MASLSRKLLKTLICKTDDGDDDDDDNDGDDDDAEHGDPELAHSRSCYTYQMPKTCNCAQLQILGVQLSKNVDRTIQRPISELLESKNPRSRPSATFHYVSAKL